MENGYLQFISLLRETILELTGLEDEKVKFSYGEHSAEADRMLVECGRVGELREACAIHTKDMYEQYRNGAEFEELVCNALNLMYKVSHAGVLDKISQLEHYVTIKKDLFVQLRNLKRNKKELAHAVYKAEGDIALVLYLKIAEEDDCLTSIKIPRQILSVWKIEEEQVFREALLNTYFLSPPRIFEWDKLMINPFYDGENFMDLCEPCEINSEYFGCCLSTVKRTNGAVAIFLPGVARRIADLMDADFYIVFTSIHEAMIHNDQVVGTAELKRILRETIKEATPPEDFLTDNIYHYERASGRFTLE